MKLTIERISNGYVLKYPEGYLEIEKTRYFKDVNKVVGAAKRKLDAWRKNESNFV